TRKGAELLRADSLGRVATGKVADLVVLDANPAANVAATRRIAWVMLRGRIFYPDSLRRTWAKWGGRSSRRCSSVPAGKGKRERGKGPSTSFSRTGGSSTAV